MRITPPAQHLVPRLAPSSAPSTHGAVVQRAETDALMAQPRRNTASAAYAPKVAVISGPAPHAQRALAAYTQHDLFAQRTEYAQLLGIDTYA